MCSRLCARSVACLLTSDPISVPFSASSKASLPLSAAEEQAVIALPLHVRTFAASQDIVRERDRPSQCCLLLEGFAARYKIVGEGRRQIMSFHLPGDIPDLLSLHLNVMDHNLATISSSRVAFIAHNSLRRLMQEHPRLIDAFWRDTLIDAAVFREWIVGIGRRDARGRTAHLICELVTRMEVVGLAHGKCVQVPLTQVSIADALGLSAVHANRVIQQLRGEGLITWRGRTLDVADWDGLTEAAEFDPTYLHMELKTAA